MTREPASASRYTLPRLEGKAPTPFECSALSRLTATIEAAEPGADVAPLAWGTITSSDGELLQELGEGLPHLQALFTSPYSRLRTETEVVPVGRARRPTRRAPELLSRHTNHWATRKFHTVVPAKIEAHRVDTQIDIYENRLALGLVELLREVVLLPRLRDMRTLRSMERELNEVHEQLGQQDWRADNRGYMAWAGALSAKAPTGLESDIEKLERLEASLRALQFGSPLAQVVPRRPPNTLELHITNLLANDQHYVYVNRLWTLLSKYQRSIQESVEQEEARLSSADVNMVSFVSLLVSSALDQVKSLSPADDTRTSFHLGEDVVRVQHEKDSTITLCAGGRRLRLIPIARELTDQPALKDIRSAPTEQVALVYLSSAEAERTADAHWRTLRLSHPQDYPDEDRLGASMVPVSPMLVTSLERVMSLCLRFVLGTAWSEGTAAVDVPSSLSDWRPSEEFALSARRLRLTRPILADSLRRQAESLDATVRQAGPRARADARNDADRVSIEINRRARAMSVLALCPVCGRQMDVLPRGRGFSSQCRSCDTTVRLDDCSSCGESFLVLDRRRRPLPEKQVDASWMDGWAGGYLLATPCWSTPNFYICSTCAVCPKSLDGACSRCSA